ncbi:phosphoglucomutase (alpha-D-glucose-1,6-bisphosphate-dependent) [Tahibacter caeni]|uniref:phosphoglucomutase (alpha-D-glucose-1,6-bisphosphate-dependent) n=1 Tax=Tahibacter caeni TaxID=1453545 RepID=UPI0021497D29|nr:phosphoglucomutase (alpha-D-glucose-1,6-bisphosphate-dependent) [Tahibacter caeni]
MNPPNPAQAGQRAGADQLVDVAALQHAYYALRPDPGDSGQRVAFGTSGHRGCAFDATFNEAHVLAITQAICDYRRANGIDGPLFLGIDTHALSLPAFDSALEVLAANGVETRIAAGGEFTPTPAISQAILVHNRGRREGLADGIVITPSHNPPQDGGFKYNPTSGGPADTSVTAAIEQRANALLQENLAGVRRLTPAQARAAATTREHDFIGNYVAGLADVIDFAAIRASGLRLGVDPLGGAGLRYWQRIAADHGLDLTVVNTQIDPQFGFMTLDWDGRIRMDPSSPPAMQSLIALRERFDVAFACDPDHDRHGIVTRSGGLMLPNNYLAVMADYLFTHRPGWPAAAGVGKTLVSSALIDRVAARLERPLVETPVGFKWFVDGLCAGSLGMGAEESAGASFLRKDGSVWSTDKDGLAPALLSAEITARLGRDPYERYRELCADLGEPHSSRRDAPATAEQKKKLSRLSPEQVTVREVGGEPVLQVLDKAPGNGAGIGGIKVVCANGWFAARPSGTEAIYKIYAESFRGEGHLQQILAEAQAVVDATLSA